MAARQRVWDLQAEGGPLELDLWACDAAEAMRVDPDRYALTLPDGLKGEAQPMGDAPPRRAVRVKAKGDEPR